MIKDVLVHLDGSSSDEDRLLHARAPAAASDAHLTGLFVNPLPDFATLVPMNGGAAAAAALSDLEQDALRQGDFIQQRLAERFSRFAVSHEIHRIDGTPVHLPAVAATEAR